MSTLTINNLPKELPCSCYELYGRSNNMESIMVAEYFDCNGIFRTDSYPINNPIGNDIGYEVFVTIYASSITWVSNGTYTSCDGI